jgi:hypothetical protein
MEGEEPKLPAVRSIAWLGCIDNAARFRIKMGPVCGCVNCDRDFASVLGVRNVMMVLLRMCRKVRGGVCKFLRFRGCQK